MRQLALIDASSVLYRCFFALPEMRAPSGEPTQALFGFAKFLLKFLVEFKGQHALIAFDGRNSKQRRTAIWPQYKAHRQRAPDDLRVQMDLSPKLCNALGLSHLNLEDEEADDLIAGACGWARADDAEVVIYSQDKDLLQLVGPKVRAILLHRDRDELDAHRVQETYGVQPDQLGDWLALVGDTSDNIPGVPGIGPKRATELLQRFGDLEGIFSGAEQLSEQMAKTLLAGREQARVSRQLVALIPDVPNRWSWNELELRAPQLGDCHDLFSNWNFRSLFRQLEGLPKRGAAPTRDPLELEPFAAKSTRDQCQLIQSAAEFTSALQQIRDCKEHFVFALDRNARVEPCGRDVATWIGIGVTTRAWLLDVELLSQAGIGWERIFEALQPHPPRFTDSAKDWYHLHLSYDQRPLDGRAYFDLALAVYLLAGQDTSLAPLADKKTLKGATKEQLAADLAERLESLAARSKSAVEDLRACDLFDLFETIERPLVPILAAMERVGICVSRSQLLAKREQLLKRLVELADQIVDLAGEHFNVNSPKQLAQILFERLGLKPPKKIATGYSTNAATLEQLRGQHPIIPPLLEYRMLEKLRSTYIEALPDFIYEATGRIHPTFAQTATATGRLSCHEPNLQNIPIKSEWGSIIRSAFVAPRNWRLVSIDYNQIELRLMAHFSEDAALISAFCEGADVHALTAAQIFRIPIEAVTRAQRAQAKAVNFGVIYGQQAFGLAGQLGISRERAEAFIRAYFERYPGVARYIEECRRALVENRTVKTLFGRKRSLAHVPARGRDPRLALRLAINTPIQGTGADLLKLAMIRIADLLKSHPARMLLQIHDELVFECPEDEVDSLVALAVPAMESAASLRVPLTVNVRVGNNWAEC